MAWPSMAQYGYMECYSSNRISDGRIFAENKPQCPCGIPTNLSPWLCADRLQRCPLSQFVLVPVFTCFWVWFAKEPDGWGWNDYTVKTCKNWRKNGDLRETRMTRTCKTVMKWCRSFANRRISTWRTPKQCTKHQRPRSCPEPAMFGSLPTEVKWTMPFIGHIIFFNPRPYFFNPPPFFQPFPSFFQPSVLYLIFFNSRSSTLIFSDKSQTPPIPIFSPAASPVLRSPIPVVPHKAVAEASRRRKQ